MSKSKTVSLKRKVDEYNFGVFYECENEKCIDEQNSSDPTNSYGYQFFIILQSFKINFQSENNLFQKSKKLYNAHFNLNSCTNLEYNWHNIIFREKKGLLKKKYINSEGFFDSETKVITKEYILPDKSNNKYYKSLLWFKINNNHAQRTEYKRKKVSFITVGANVLSYFSNVFFILKLIYFFYTRRFNNFKILEQLFINKFNNNLLIKQNEENENFDKKKGGFNVQNC